MSARLQTIKTGFTSATISDVLRQRAVSSGWALCIGAGTSYPMFPDWYSLVAGLVEKDTDAAVAAAIMPKLSQSFGLDALVQAAKGRSGLAPDAFANLLSDQLYARLKQRLSASDWKIFRRGLSAFRPGDMTPQMWRRFGNTVSTHFPTVSAIQIADAVVRSRESGIEPAAILSFNAEPLLYALINARVSVVRTRLHSPTAVLNRITRSLSNRNSELLSFVFCHGLLPIEGHPSPDWHSLDKLVFSETDYLQVANSGFTWQSSTFFDTCMSRSTVFIGLSFSDPNLRRWLGIMHQNRVRELQNIGHVGVASAPHYWFRIMPKTSEERDWIEAAVSHLGVRLVWLNGWNEVGTTLRRMLGL
jgi:hypothetical protein